MPRFFINDMVNEEYILQGENGRHAAKSLRMKVGEELVLCDGKGQDYLCEITNIDSDAVAVKLVKAQENQAESPVRVTLYQCLPKSDKMDLIVQKAVELGVHKIVPVISSRCIAKFNGKEEKKLLRLQKISEEAAKQCGRGIVPQIMPVQKFNQAVQNASGKKIFCYEKGGEHFSQLLKENCEEISILIGSEGGFSEEEANFASENGFVCASLGKRILRTETAGLCALSIIMYEVDR